ncbi:hypothetical protein [Bacillus marinisedimentorum]|uniref:hypothetical protein n=1 Tax=Bacillus marinisedimentorum TaxID=1821260 RepID=UPI0007DE6626|nr:hypothetical protein [Bacillus marinisedimentorum]
MPYQGDTVRFKCHFKSFSGQAVDPTDVTLTIYDDTEAQIEQFVLSDSDKESVGVYFYDYVLPDDKPEIIFEFRGLHNNKPILVRDTVSIKFN